jgi:hypothetical protein
MTSFNKEKWFLASTGRSLPQWLRIGILFLSKTIFESEKVRMWFWHAGTESEKSQEPEQPFCPEFFGISRAC